MHRKQFPASKLQVFNINIQIFPLVKICIPNLANRNVLYLNMQNLNPMNGYSDQPL